LSEAADDGRLRKVQTMQTHTSEPVTFGKGIQALLDTPYARYLDLETLFDIQIAERGSMPLHHPEEMLFRSVHMSSELWLRLAGFELERAEAVLDAGIVIQSARLVRRAVDSIERVTENTAMLEGLSAADYHVFRVHFGEASGLQSPGYAFVRQQCRALSGSLDRVIGDDDELFELYTAKRDDPRYDLCQALLDLDAALDRFRALLLQIAQRFLGEMTAGTGGQGVDYLRRNVGHQLFPRLWDVGDRIARASGAVPYGYGNTSNDH
jgi:tryptophan 2,3-dioxygenase